MDGLSPAAASPGAAPRTRNSGIDLLRGLSIVLVVMHHTALRIPLDKGVLADWLPSWFLYGIQYNGFESVFLFFVISGFLITSNSLARWGALAAIDAKAFYRRRAARILPCLLILVAVLCALALAGLPHYTLERPGQTLRRAALAAIGLHVNWYEARTGYLPAGWDVLWSLSIEEAFYLAFPVVCLLLGRTRLLVPALLLLALSIPVVRASIHHNEIWSETNYLQGMAAIATGVLAALLVRRWPAASASTVHWTTLLGVVALAAVYFAGTALWRTLGQCYMLDYTFGSAALVIAARWRAAAPDAAPPWRAFGWLRSFGRLSYEVYLTHMFVVWLVVDRFTAAGGDLRTGWIWYPPVLGGAWALGWLVARFVSNPLERALLPARASRVPARALTTNVLTPT
ncbi:MAG: acyltransferase family protein [Vitreoscilla sp.]